MAKLELFDESFDSNRSESYELSIQFSLNGFSFCILDSVRNCHIALVGDIFENIDERTIDWSDIINQIASKYPIVTSAFRKVQLSYETEVFSLIPAKYFEPNRAKQLLELTCTLKELDEIRFNHISSGIVSVFTIPSRLVSSWSDLQPKTLYRGIHEPLICMARACHTKTHTDTYIVIHIGSANPFIVLASAESIMHCGPLGSLIVDDIAYHTINICQSYGMVVPKVRLYITGTKLMAYDVKALLERYLQSAQVGLPGELPYYSYQLSEYRSQFAPLFNLPLCE